MNPKKIVRAKYNRSLSKRIRNDNQMKLIYFEANTNKKSHYAYNIGLNFEILDKNAEMGESKCDVKKKANFQKVAFDHPLIIFPTDY